MFVILQKYDFSSKSQREKPSTIQIVWCLWYCKSTIFQANHNPLSLCAPTSLMFVILQKYDFSSKSQRGWVPLFARLWCLWYCKSTIFQANHNVHTISTCCLLDVCDTAKVRFFKQITTYIIVFVCFEMMFVILQKYDFSSKSQHPKTWSHRKAWCLWYCKSTIFQANHNSKENSRVSV